MEYHWYHGHLKPTYPHADCPELDGPRGRIVRLFTRCRFCDTLTEGSIALAKTSVYQVDADIKEGCTDRDTRFDTAAGRQGHGLSSKLM